MANKRVRKKVTKRKGVTTMTTKRNAETNSNFKFTKKKPEIPLTIVAFGQGAGNIANSFAALRTSNGKSAYEVFAVNTSRIDLTTLESIPTENQIWFGKDDKGKDFNGFGKDAERGTQILRRDKNAKKIIDNLINVRLAKPEQQNLLFMACEGGGTGTSVLNEAIKAFYKAYREPIQDKAREKLIAYKNKFIDNYGSEKGEVLFKEKRPEIMAAIQAFITEELNKKRLMVLITLPSDAEGSDILRQVSNYASEVWEMAMDDKYHIGNLIVVDNKHLEKEYNELQINQTNERLFGYINNKVVSILHELNVAASVGDTDIALDGQDLEGLWFNGKGAMFYGKQSKPISQIKDNTSIIAMFKEALKKSYLHGDIKYIDSASENNQQKQVAKKIQNALLFAVVPDKEAYNGEDFLPQVRDLLSEELYMSPNTRVYQGFIEDKSVQEVTVYVAYKLEGLPVRLETGLMEEYEAIVKRAESVEFELSGVNKIQSSIAMPAVDALFESLDKPTTPTQTAATSDDEDFFATIDATFSTLAPASNPEKEEVLDEKAQLEKLMSEIELDIFENN